MSLVSEKGFAEQGKGSGGSEKGFAAPGERVYIFDTTLRDGEQSPGCSMTLDEKLQIAEVLESLRVDIVEAGFPAASPGDFSAVRTIAGRLKETVVAGLARARKEDILQAGEALRGVERSRIHTFISTSPLHMRHKLRMRPEEVLDAIISSVGLARNLCADVEWSCEDGSRSAPDFLCRCVEAAISAGATTINIPDTVGYAIPKEIGALFSMLRERVPNIDKARLSTHCHDDLGLATANSLAAVAAGARQVECTLNGIGERAGNAALEEVVMAMKTRSQVFPFTCGVETTSIARASRLLSSITGFLVPPNKAIIGANAFAHEAGIHQDGMLKHAQTYEIMTPESVGIEKSSLILGKHSGRHAFQARLKGPGIWTTRAGADRRDFSTFQVVGGLQEEDLRRRSGGSGGGHRFATQGSFTIGFVGSVLQHQEAATCACGAVVRRANVFCRSDGKRTGGCNFQVYFQDFPAQRRVGVVSGTSGNVGSGCTGGGFSALARGGFVCEWPRRRCRHSHCLCPRVHQCPQSPAARQRSARWKSPRSVVRSGHERDSQQRPTSRKSPRNVVRSRTRARLPHKSRVGEWPADPERTSMLSIACCATKTYKPEKPEERDSLWARARLPHESRMGEWPVPMRTPPLPERTSMHSITCCATKTYKPEKPRNVQFAVGTSATPTQISYGRMAGADADTVSARAHIDALNHLLHNKDLQAGKARRSSRVGTSATPTQISCGRMACRCGQPLPERTSMLSIACCATKTYKPEKPERCGSLVAVSAIPSNRALLYLHPVPTSMREGQSSETILSSLPNPNSALSVSSGLRLILQLANELAVFVRSAFSRTPRSEHNKFSRRGHTSFLSGVSQTKASLVEKRDRKSFRCMACPARTPEKRPTIGPPAKRMSPTTSITL